jgi:hypothetical protein
MEEAQQAAAEGLEAARKLRHLEVRTLTGRMEDEKRMRHREQSVAQAELARADLLRRQEARSAAEELEAARKEAAEACEQVSGACGCWCLDHAWGWCSQGYRVCH